ncbi:Coproporphyrinogen-III oxidase [Parahypoxylon ruwenzoriense]
MSLLDDVTSTVTTGLHNLTPQHSNHDPPPPSPSLLSGAGGSSSSNPPSLIPPAHRPLLTTLYALYPLTLLPALDLLDRRLATRIVICAPDPSGAAAAATADNHFYLVRSAQPPSRRHGSSSASSNAGGPSYVVRLDAWNCTCAAFAFAAFPREDYHQHHQHHHQQISSSSSSSYAIEPRGVPPAAAAAPGGSEKAEKEEERWHFGALSLDGVADAGGGGGGGAPPCCKHLLACVLAERWAGVLGAHVGERVVGKEEAAGLVVDI